MPAYDQTNPNFAAYFAPSRFTGEYVPPTPPSTTPTLPIANVLCGSPPCVNPYDQSWLPFGPIPGDTRSLGYWFSATCCPTAEAMALVGAINSKSAGTTYQGWTRDFHNGVAPAASTTGLVDQVGPIFPFIPDPRQHMQPIDLQRVMSTALKQGTLPNAGGGADYIVSRGADFTPAGSGTNGGADTVSNGTFISLMSGGSVVVFGIHDYTAHVSTQPRAPFDASMTFTFNGGGHCMVFKGYSTSLIAFLPRLEVIDPVYGVTEWISITTIATGNLQQPMPVRKLNVTLPNGWKSVGIWPDSAHPVASAWDIQDGQTVTFIDEYHTLNVP
jgi:hypothetical protein